MHYLWLLYKIFELVDFIPFTPVVATAIAFYLVKQPDDLEAFAVFINALASPFSCPIHQ